MILFLIFYLVMGYTSRWSADQATKYMDDLLSSRPLIGMNYIPSPCDNELEMWQNITWNPKQIDWELSLAQEIGFNGARVFLHNLAYYEDPDGFKARIDEFLGIADKYDILVMFVLFDDCWNYEPRIGPQPAPIPGVHNSQWLQSPGDHYYNDDLNLYVTDIVSTFANDSRIFLWDVMNEPGNSGHGEKALPLLKNVFKAARSSDPSQPLTSGYWNPLYHGVTDYQLQNSDILSFHNYEKLPEVKDNIELLQLNQKGYPMICSEYMARPMGSLFQTHLPFFADSKIPAFNWGFVDGATQTKYAWSCTVKNPCQGEPELWFHDVTYPNGTSYWKNETDLIHQLAYNEYP